MDSENKPGPKNEINKVYQLLDKFFELHRLLHRWLLPVVKTRGLSVSELGVFWILSRHGRYRLTDLSRELGVPASTLTGIIDRLVLQDYVFRVRSDDDRRSVEISPTPKLLETSSVLKKAIRGIIAEALAEIPLAVLENAGKDLEVIITHLIRYERERL
jgi:DNA-binding MarR family transcriptional regulator